MASDWKDAHKSLHGMYDVFKPSTLSNVDGVQIEGKTSRQRKNAVHVNRAKIAAANFLTLGLSNVYWLGKCKSSLEKKEFNRALSIKVGNWSDRVCQQYNLDGRELSSYLEFRLGITDTPPDVNPVSSAAFAFGWNELRQDHAAKLAEFGVS